MADAARPDRRPELVALGNVVKRHREAKGWTLDTLASESGLSRRTVINIESGTHSAGVDALFDLAAALDARLSELIRDAEVDPEP